MKVLQRRTAIASVMANLVFATAALAQMPTSPWKKGAPFPEPDEELYGVALNGKMYVIGGATTVDGSKDPFFTFFGPSKVLATNDVYDPATNKWQSRTPM